MEFYCPVNTVKVTLSWSVNLFNQQENGSTKSISQSIAMSHIVTGLEFELATLEMQSDAPTTVLWSPAWNSRIFTQSSH